MRVPARVVLLLSAATIALGCAEEGPAERSESALAPLTCGNGQVDQGEQCDGQDLAGETCASVTMGTAVDGVLGCSSACVFATDQCAPSGGGGGSGGSGGIAGADAGPGGGGTSTSGGAGGAVDGGDEPDASAGAGGSSGSVGSGGTGGLAAGGAGGLAAGGTSSGGTGGLASGGVGGSSAGGTGNVSSGGAAGSADSGAGSGGLAGSTTGPKRIAEGGGCDCRVGRQRSPLDGQTLGALSCAALALLVVRRRRR